MTLVREEPATTRRGRTLAVDGVSGPVRTCIVTREAAPVDRLVRFAVAPDGDVVPDVEGKLPGRGFWLLARRDIVQKARAQNLFAKAARARVTCPEDLADRVEGLLSRRCLDLIGLARRAGQAWSGYEKARSARGRTGVLLIAADAAPGSRQKLGAPMPGVVVVDLFDGRELGSVFGRDRTVFAGLAPGRIAERLTGEAGRLAGFRLPSHSGKLN